MFNWEGVTEFVAVSEAESFTAAAKKIGISTAQASRQISALEDRLSTKLFYRTTRRVSMTEAGQIYYQHCRQIIDALDDAERAINNLQSTPKGKLKITAPTIYGASKIAPLLNSFLINYPDLDVEFELTNQKLDLVEGGFDVAIRLGKLEDSSMMAKRLADRKQYVCASKKYIALNGMPHSLSELDQHNCLRGTLDYWRFQENGDERNIKVSGNIRCNSGNALLDAALKGLGIVQLPDYYVEEALRTGQLIPLLSNLQPSGEGVWAIYPHNRHLSPKVRMLVDFLSTELPASTA